MKIRNFYYDQQLKKFYVINDKGEIKVLPFDNSIYIRKQHLPVLKDYIEYLNDKIDEFNLDTDLDLIETLKSVIRISKTNFKTLNDEEIIKIVVKRKDIYENLKKFFADNDVELFGEFIKKFGLFIFDKIQIDMRYWFIDIEVFTKDLKLRDNTVGNPKQPIISIQIFDSGITDIDKPKIFILLNNEIIDVQEKFFMNNDKFEQIKPNVFLIKHNEINVYFILSENEMKMLLYFIYLFRKYKPFLISGWFSNQYDIPYIAQRMLIHNIFDEWRLIEFDNIIENNKPYFNIFDVSHEVKYHINIPMVHFVDYRDLYEKFISTKPESWSLNFVSKLVLGEGKQEFGFLNYETNFEEFLKYIIRDVEILYLMENKLKLIELLKTFNEIIPIKTNYLLKSVVTIEAYLNLFGFNQNVLLPFKSRKQTEDEEGFEGAYVRQPESKIYDNVFVFDFQSLYPNIIRTFNISFETLVQLAKDKVFDENTMMNHLKLNTETLLRNNDGKVMYVDMNNILDEKSRNAKQVYYVMKKKNLIKDMVNELLEKRDFYKSEYKRTGTISDYNKQLNYKILANSIYGVFGTKSFTFYNPIVSASITGTGRFLLKNLMNFIENRQIEIDNVKYQLEPVYGDTDSVFIHVRKRDPTGINKLEQEEINKLSTYIRDLINNYIRKLIKDSKIFVNFDKDIDDIITLKIEIDKIFKKVKFFGVKKRYYGYDYENNCIYKGIELARSDSSKWLKDNLKQMFDFLLELGDDIEKNKHKIEYQLIEIYRDLQNRKLEEIGDSKTVNNIDSYVVVPYHIRGLKLFCELFEFDEQSFVTQKVYVIPIKVYKDFEKFNYVKKLFNEKRKNITEIECYISIPTTIFENSEIISKVEEYLKNNKNISINYLKIFENFTNKLEGFNIDKIIETTFNKIIMEMFDKQQMLLFNMY